MSDGVVFQMSEDDPARHGLVLKNVANLRRELGADVPVELVLFGPGLSLGRSDGPSAQSLAALVADGLELAVCANALREQGLDIEQMVEGAHTVPAGVAELVRRQQQGWAYLRP
jgi:intracellular sulfur oxidation DsrE/DsrF family protein